MLRRTENNGRVFWCLEAIIHYGHLSRNRAFKERAKAEKKKWEAQVKAEQEARRKEEEAQKRKAAASKVVEAEAEADEVDDDGRSSVGSSSDTALHVDALDDMFEAARLCGGQDPVPLVN